MDVLFEAFMKYYIFIDDVEIKDDIMSFRWKKRQFSVSELNTGLGLYHLREITGTLEEYGSTKAIIEALYR
jgi:hypothetical protein